MASRSELFTAPASAQKVAKSVPLKEDMVPDQSAVDRLDFGTTTTIRNEVDLPLATQL
jgi:hypothetical protein